MKRNETQCMRLTHDSRALERLIMYTFFPRIAKRLFADSSLGAQITMRVVNGLTVAARLYIRSWMS